MGQYNRSYAISDTTDPNNLILLREDIHSAFDNKSFILVPKEGKLVVHFLRYLPPVTDIFHNREIGEMDVSKEMAYARFAWSLFPLIGGGNISKRTSGIFISVYDITGNQYLTKKMGKEEMTVTIRGDAGAKKRKILQANLNQMSEALEGNLEGIAHHLEVLLPPGIEAHYRDGHMELSVNEADKQEAEETAEASESSH